MPVVRDHRAHRVKQDLQDQRAILVQVVKWGLRDPKDRRVRPDRRDQRAIRVQLVKRVPKARRALKAQLVRLGLLNRRSALLQDQTARLCAMKMRF